MGNLRKPEEIIIEGVSLEKLIESHKKWLDNEKSGKQLILENADLSYANLIGVDLSYANLRRTDLEGADLEGVNLENADLRYVNLKNANLKNADLEDADLIYTNLENADLRFTNLKNANLYNAYLKNADLRKANLIGANLYDANLYNADLRKANLVYANLENISLKNTKFYLTNLYKVKRKDLFEVGNIGSRNDTTHYFIEDNRIICGCFDNTLENFEEKVKYTYDKNSKEYMEYMIAIDTFKNYKEMYRQE